MSIRDTGGGSIIIQPQPERRLKRTDDIAERIKDLIVEQSLKPGDRLPNERELIDHFHASKSTVREALKGLETQGLVRSRTGPGGGTFVDQLSGSRAMELLSNFFFFRQPSIGDIYAVRIKLEPDLAVSVIGHLRDEDYETLQRTMRLYERPPRDRGEEYRQRLAELDFHSVLAELSPNPILGFICGFMHNLLRNLTICRHIYGSPNPELREAALHYQIQLIRALKAEDADAARKIMLEHMESARRYMEESEAVFTGGFLRLDRKPPSR
jgi:DNA-binding FadR family transcriptional regulator